MIKPKQINRIMKKKKLLSILLVFIMAFAVPMSAFAVPMSAFAEEISETDSVEETETLITSDIDSVEETESLITPDSEEYIAEEEPMKTVEDDTNIEAEPEAEIISAEEPQEDGSTEITKEFGGSTANSVAYRTHVQTYGWQDFVADGAISGTAGQAKRLEAIEIKLENTSYEGSIEYRTHVQTYGWQDWVSDGDMSGTSGQAKRLEAIQIRLTGKIAERCDVLYRVHAQSYGWLGWAKNGESAGTAGYGKRLEAIEILVLGKGSPLFLSQIKGEFGDAYKHPQIQYKTHVQTYGWQGWKKEGAMSGTSGQAKRLEAIHIALCDQDYTGGVRYRTHVQTYGWQDYVADGAMSGTSGQAKRLEAIQIELTGEMANHYDIYYRVHAQTFGWLGWAKNGEKAGTAGYAKRLEGIEIRLVSKGGDAPGSTENVYKEVSGNTDTGESVHTHTWTTPDKFVIKCLKCTDMYFEESRDRTLHNVAYNCYGGYSVVRAPGKVCSACGKYESTKHVHSWKPSEVKLVKKQVQCQCGKKYEGYVNEAGKYITAEANWRYHSSAGTSNDNGTKHTTFTETTGEAFLTIPTQKCSCGLVPGAFTRECVLYQNLIKGKDEIIDIIIDGKGGCQIDDIVAKSAK